MSTAPYDLVVIGAGPAGAISALIAAKSGARTLIVEKNTFPRYKVCGGCLSPLAVKTLQENNLQSILAESPVLARMELIDGRSAAGFAVFNRRIISREVLDTRLLEAAKSAGAQVITDTTALLEKRSGHSCLVRLRGERAGEQTVRARLVINASGLQSEALKFYGSAKTKIKKDSHVGFGATIASDRIGLSEQSLKMLTTADGYLGAVVLNDQRINLAAALSAKAVREGSHQQILTGLLGKLFPEAMKSESELLWQTVPFLGRQPSKTIVPGLISVGDAAGYTEPFTGEGMGWALASGALATNLAIAEGFSNLTSAKWQNLYQRKIRTKHRGTKLVGKIVASRFRQNLFAQSPLIGQISTKLAYQLYRILNDVR